MLTHNDTYSPYAQKLNILKLKARARVNTSHEAYQARVAKVYGDEAQYRLAMTEAGCPSDQQANFIRYFYVAQSKQIELHAAARAADLPDAPHWIALGGARGPGKTHAIIAQLVFDDCQRRAGVKVLFLREVGRTARESFDDVRQRIMQGVSHQYNQSSGVVSFDNGSRLVMGYFRTANDINQYLGIEYDVIAIEEATQIPSDRIEKLRGSLRTSKPDWRTRIYFSFNPGGVSHGYFRAEFVLPYRKRQITDKLFIPSTYRNNTFIDDAYRQWLEGLAGDLGKMWRDGNMDVAAGAYFETWSPDTHLVELDSRLIDAQGHLHKDLRASASMDFGFDHWNMIHLHVELGDGQTFTVHEVAHRHCYVSEVAADFKAVLATYGLKPNDLWYFLAGADAFRNDGRSQLSIAEQWNTEGFSMALADNTPGSRIAGAMEMSRRLGDPRNGKSATWFIVAANCPMLAEQIPLMQRDESKREDVKKVDCDSNGRGGDDGYDSARFYLWKPNAGSVA